MRRREFITLLGGAAAAWPLAARAQQPKRIPRLCFLTFDPGTLRSTRFEAFFQGLHDLGYGRANHHYRLPFGGRRWRWVIALSMAAQTWSPSNEAPAPAADEIRPCNPALARPHRG
jgi:hypothetical protein